MRAAFRLTATEGIARLEKQARWLEREYPDAAASLREGLAEMFTINCLGLSQALCRCLCSTNIIESPHRGAVAHAPHLPLAGWKNGAPLGSGHVSDHREEFSQGPRLPGSVDVESSLG